MSRVDEVESPVNANERFLYAIAMRLGILIEQVSAITEHLAKQSNVAVESNVVSDALTSNIVENTTPTPRKTRGKVRE
jgi:hypothetical protein